MLSDFNMSSTDAFRTGPAYILCINYPQVLGALFVVACSNLYLESWLFSDPSLPFHIHKKHTWKVRSREPIQNRALMGGLVQLFLEYLTIACKILSSRNEYFPS